MKIATWNLESLRPLTPERKVAFRDAVKDVKADVWVLTETWTDLEPLPGYELVAQSSEAGDLKAERRWVSIWVCRSHTAKGLKIQSAKQQDRMAAAQITNPNRGGIMVVGTVLPWNSDKLWPGADGFCNALAEQATEWKWLKELSDIGSFLVAGDFNQSLPNQSRYGSKQGAIDLLETLKRQDLFCLTPGNVPLTDKPRIDHICIGRSGLHQPFLPQVDSWEVPCLAGKAITDHSGVFVELDVS